MTIFKAREIRAGKKVSAKNLQQLANAHHALKAIATDAGVDLDEIPPVGGPDGTLGNPAMSNGQVSAPDGTGQRAAGRPAGPTIRTVHGQTYEVR